MCDVYILVGDMDIKPEADSNDNMECPNDKPGTGRFAFLMYFLTLFWLFVFCIFLIIEGYAAFVCTG